MTDLIEPCAKLCQVSDIAEGASRGFGIGDEGSDKVIVVHKNGRFYGWLDACPHYETGTPMAWRKDAYLDGQGEHIACHAHGALFDIESGICVAGPCLGKALTAIPLIMTEGGEILIHP